jgi:surface protein
MFKECRKLHTLRLDDCSRETVERIINSSDLPTGGAEDYEGTRQIFVNPDDIGDLTAPDGWVFVDRFTGEEIKPDEDPIPLYEPNQFQGDTIITEVKTMVNTSHNSLDYMFDGCTALTTVNTTDWDTSNVYNMEYMFRNCTSLTELDLSSFVTSNHNTGMFNYMFYGCTALETLDIRNFALSYYDSEEGYMAQSMFENCTSLHTIYMNNCNAFTIAEITNSLNSVSYKGSQPQIIYCKDDNLIHPGSGTRIQPPSGWRFEYVD